MIGGVVLTTSAGVGCGDSERAHELRYEVVAEDADGECEVCERESVELVGVVSTDASDPILIPTSRACLFEHVRLASETEVLIDEGFACIDVEVDWPVRRDEPVRYVLPLGVGSPSETTRGLLTDGHYVAEVLFEGDDEASAGCEFSVW